MQVIFSVHETWRKLRLSIRYLYENAIEYDWFVRSCDDTYFIVENLRRFLAEKNPDVPHFFGRIAPVRFTSPHRYVLQINRRNAMFRVRTRPASVRFQLVADSIVDRGLC